jgi:predicted DsbA family dithiol-disulfide isomerase
MQQFQKQKPQPKKTNNAAEAGKIKVAYYTDPLCCWSWAFERHWQELLHRHQDRITHEYVMGGLIPHWKNYNDPLNAVSRPIQMGPVWMHASEVTQTKMKYNIWHEDPPASSYPACIAVKTVGLQSSCAAEKYLFEIRRALMEDGLNISKTDVLFAIAESLKTDGFDFLTFQDDWRTEKGKEGFRQDLQKTKYHNIGRFPTLTMLPTHGKGLMIVGYRPYEALQQAFDAACSSSSV